ncbi:glycogen synthase GlgA [candidate division KSB1 bacterium]|nr:glycogen synthase GlgA [candidate division KSB1 bacterium]
MRKTLKILYISSEVSPFAKTGGLADVSESLPKELKESAHDIRIFMPKYGSINERKFVLREVIRLKDIQVPVGNKVAVANVKSSFLPQAKVQIYFIGNKEYFSRTGYYVDPKTNKDWKDNAERFIFLCRATLEILKKLHWQPDIIHCNDWQTALIPYLLKTVYQNDKFFKDIKTLLSLHNLSFQGIFEKKEFALLASSQDVSKPDSSLEFFGKINFLKAGIINADFLHTVSKRYAKEVQQSDEYGFGLQDILKKKSKKLTGIINGVDYSIWNPETDKLLPNTYSRKDLKGKMENKRLLVESQGLIFKENIPVLGTISRITEQKGFDIIIKSIDKIMRLDLQYIILGTGEIKYHKLLEKLAKKYPGKLAVNIKFDDELAHQIEAGADMFLMPSKFEPCGLNQLYSLKYGTIPIVRATGGLADTVKNFSQETGRGYGFVFEEYSSAALISTIEKAIAVYHNDKLWKKLIERAMKLDFSWQVVTEKYLNLYNSLLS